MWYKNGIPSVYHLSIRAKHVSVFRTAPIDGIHHVFHACMPCVQLVVFRPGVQLVVCSQWYPASLSCGGGWSAVLHKVFRKPAKISTGYAKYMTNQKRNTTIMAGIYY